jgi:hypothetical protein
MEKPKMLQYPLDKDLKQQVEDYVEEKHCKHEDCDCRHYIYEAAIEAYYGKGIWKWLNSKNS